jgi:hypothetical protein
MRAKCARVYPYKPGDHAPAAPRATFFASLEALNRKKVRVLYRGFDFSVPGHVRNESTSTRTRSKVPIILGHEC